MSSCMFRISMVDDITVTVGWHRSFIRAGGGCFRILNSLALATVNPNPRLPRSKSHYYLRRRILGIRQQEFSHSGQRVSLTCLCFSSAKNEQATLRLPDALSVLVPLPSVDGQAQKEIGLHGVAERSLCCLHVVFIPHNEQSVWTWHRNESRYMIDLLLYPLANDKNEFRYMFDCR